MTLRNPSKKNRMKPHVHPLPIVSPATHSLQPGTLRVGPRAAAQATFLIVASPKNSLLPTSFLCRVTRRSSASCCLPAVWFQSQGCHIRQLTPSNSICGQRSSRCTTADTQVLKSHPTLVLICSQLKGTETNKDCSIRARMKHHAENTQILRYQPAEVQQTSFSNTQSPPLSLISWCCGSSTVL